MGTIIILIIKTACYLVVLYAAYSTYRNNRKIALIASELQSIRDWGTRVEEWKDEYTQVLTTHKVALEQLNRRTNTWRSEPY